jgi:hypothetical protein
MRYESIHRCGFLASESTTITPSYRVGFFFGEKAYHLKCFFILTLIGIEENAVTEIKLAVTR